MKTPERALVLARNWFTAAVCVLFVRLTLDAVGIDLISLPLEGVTTLCLMCSMGNSGYARGYRIGSQERTGDSDHDR